MNSVKQKLIIKLTGEAFEAAKRYESIGMRNVYGLSHEEQKECSADYALARVEMIEAHNRLRAAEYDEKED